MRTQRLVAAVLLASVLGSASSVSAQVVSGPTVAQNGCAPGASPGFVGPLAQLKAQLGDWQGDPTTCEFPDPAGSGDTFQRTTTGLAYHRQANDNFGFTNGVDHWALTSSGLVYWNGASVDPPTDASPARPNPCVAASTCRVAAAVTPTPAPTPLPTAAPVYSTSNGPRTEAQLRQELTSAGYAGPWDVTSMLAAYGRADQRIPPYPNDTTWACLPDNPSCAHDPWWAEWNSLQDDAHVTYSAIGSGFTTERRYAEAIDLLWQWPQGKTLLQTADRQHVLVMTIDYDEQTAFAAYVVDRHTVAVNRRIVGAPTWMLASVLAHELWHAKDNAEGVNAVPDSADCYAEETAAFVSSRDFIAWLTHTLRPDGLPSLAQVSANRNPDEVALAAMSFEIRSSGDMSQFVHSLYADECG